MRCHKQLSHPVQVVCRVFEVRVRVDLGSGCHQKHHPKRHRVEKLPTLISKLLIPFIRWSARSSTSLGGLVSATKRSNSPPAPMKRSLIVRNLCNTSSVKHMASRRMLSFESRLLTGTAIGRQGGLLSYWPPPFDWGFGSRCPWNKGHHQSDTVLQRGETLPDPRML